MFKKVFEFTRAYTVQCTVYMIVTLQVLFERRYGVLSKIGNIDAYFLFFNFSKHLKL